MLRKKKKQTVPQPCMVIGPNLTNMQFALKHWKYAIAASFEQGVILQRAGVNVTDYVERAAHDRVGKMVAAGHDPIFLCGPGWMEDPDTAKNIALIAHETTTTIIDLSGSNSPMLPRSSMQKIMGWYADGIAQIAWEDPLSQRERVARWLVANGYCFVGGHCIEFQGDWEHLRKVMLELGITDVEREIENARDRYGKAERI